MVTGLFAQCFMLASRFNGAREENLAFLDALVDTLLLPRSDANAASDTGSGERKEPLCEASED
jgi:hypothetical protein